MDIRTLTIALNKPVVFGKTPKKVDPIPTRIVDMYRFIKGYLKN